MGSEIKLQNGGGGGGGRARAAGTSKGGLPRDPEAQVTTPPSPPEPTGEEGPSVMKAGDQSPQSRPVPDRASAPEHPGLGQVGGVMALVVLLSWKRGQVAQ